MILSFSMVFAGKAAIAVIVILLCIACYLYVKKEPTVETPPQPAPKKKERIKTTEHIRDLRNHAERILASCSGNEDLTRAMSTIVEDLRYSDPVSVEEIFPIESEIEEELTKLEHFLEESPQKATEQMNKISGLIQTRNRQCVSMK